MAPNVGLLSSAIPLLFSDPSFLFIYRILLTMCYMTFDKICHSVFITKYFICCSSCLKFPGNVCRSGSLRLSASVGGSGPSDVVFRLAWERYKLELTGTAITGQHGLPRQVKFVSRLL